MQLHPRPLIDKLLFERVSPPRLDSVRRRYFAVRQTASRSMECDPRPMKALKPEKPRIGLAPGWRSHGFGTACLHVALHRYAALQSFGPDHADATDRSQASIGSK